jgi:hypothetical protein
VTLSLKGPYGGAMANQPENADAERPPAIFYGEVKSSPTFTAQPGMMVTAQMGNAICGQSQTIEADGTTRYVIDVRAVAQAGNPACGLVGGIITFAIDGHDLSPTAAWDNSQMWSVDLGLAP